MARHQQVSFTLTCDVCGDEIADGDTAGASRKVSWGGAGYQMDLCSIHQKELDGQLARLKVFVDAGQPVVARRGRAATRGASRAPRSIRSAAPSAPAAGRRSDAPEIRAWARENGYQVGDRARIAGLVIAAYDEAQSGGAATANRPRRRAGKPSVGEAG